MVTKMKYNPILNYFRKVQGKIEEEKYKTIIDDLFYVPEMQLEALWNFLVAGYPVDFSIKNYVNLFEYARDNSVDYSTAIETYYCISYGVKAGVDLENFERFDLN